MEADLRLASPLVIGATGMDAIIQNIRIIATTFAYSVPLDRGFAHLGGFLDTPTMAETARKMAELTAAIEEKEPRVKVFRIWFENRPDDAHEGRLYPVITFVLKDGVTL